METQIYQQQQKTINMNKLLNCIIATIGGAGASYWTWEQFYDKVFTIFCGIFVTVASGIILHYLLPHIPKFDWGKKKKK